MKKKLITYSISFAAGFLLALGAAFTRGLASAGSPSDVLKYLSDGLFISGMVFICIGLLILISTTGFFDMFSYGFKSTVYLFTPIKRKEKEDYYTYREHKNEHRGKKQMFLIWTGLALILLSVLALFIFYRI